MTRSPTFELDVSRATPARVYDYYLGGKDNSSVDRKAADKMIAVLPRLPMMARANRRFLLMAVRHLVGDLGIRQIIDVGSGLPTRCNVHEVAQDIEPTARVVYIDNDPMVTAHARALLVSTPAGRVAVLTADATDPGAVLNNPVVASTLDLSLPVAIILTSVLMYFPDAVAHHIVSTLVAGVPAGSCLVLSHPTADFAPETVAEVVVVAQKGGLTHIPRTRAQVERFFTGLDLAPPGITPLLGWRPPSLSEYSADAPSIELSAAAMTSVYDWVGIGRRRPLIDTEHTAGTSLPPAGRC